MHMFGALGVATVAVLMGGALGLLRGPSFLAIHPAVLGIPFLVAAGIIFIVYRFWPAASDTPSLRSRRILVHLGLGVLMAVLVLVSESLLLLDWPSGAGLIAGLGLSVVTTIRGVSAVFEPDDIRLRVLLLYLAAGLVAISTLLTSLPPSAFWVISGIIPAWQARRLALRGESALAARMLQAAVRLFVGVLGVALILPALLLLR